MVEEDSVSTTGGFLLGLIPFYGQYKLGRIATRSSPFLSDVEKGLVVGAEVQSAIELMILAVYIAKSAV